MYKRQVPKDNKIYAPFSGTIQACFPTKHAVGMAAEDGTEVLLHIGIDTVKLNGEGFKTFIEQGQKVKQGDLLAEVELDYVKAQGYDPVVIVIFPTKEVTVKGTHKEVKKQQTIDVKLV